MKIAALVRSELRRLTASPLARLAFIALMCVPLLYGGMYLWANQDPYAKLDHIPAAIVDNDAGATDSDGNAVDYGQKITDQLVDGNDFDWHVVSQAEADKGIKDETYNFVFSIPKSFSTDLTSASTTDPTAAKIDLTTNDTTSYLSSTIADQAGKTIRATITAEVGKTAAKTLLVGLNDVRDNLKDASAGSSKVTSGATDLKSGLDSAKSGATKLASGASQLSTGASSLNTGLQQLRTKTAALPAQTAQLSSGLDSLQSQTSSLPAESAALDTGAQKVAAGNKALDDGVALQKQAASDVKAALPAQLLAAQKKQQAALNQIYAATGMTDAQKAAIQQVVDASNDSTATKLTSAATAAETQLSTLETTTGQLATGSAQVAAGTSELSAQTPALVSGIQQLDAGANELSTAAPALTSGIASAADGSAQLASGAATASTGASSLSSGITKLDSGAKSLVTGSTKLTKGLKDGVKQIPATTAATRDTQAAAIADPVSIRDSSIASAGNYGAGLAPFFISLAAWIGMYALFLIIKPISKRALTAVRAPGRITLAGWLSPAILGLVQMVALFAIVKFALGFDVVNPVPMVGLMVLASITFAAIIMMLNVLLGSVGQFLGLVLMLIQLVTAGGTFPWQTLPGPLAALHFALPMSYAVDGIRQLMYGGNIGAAWSDAGVLALWMIGALLVSFVAARRMTKRRTMRDLRPSLIG
ncbi:MULTISPECIES: YhgE/Pip domain-containing protein [unclassified Frondihabitans]|uniref:YhgE/Pip domain-containing protein n=1 Tax=unclassified Frondihabitans TaxID=2626248 RepID=UPI000F4FBE68|nr:MULTISPECIES: YhgE/Pip domain-containing protein [unclassified Frondihabitans]RPE78211.1 putative membrane protein [Frondihabitans sp. PhB153]RPF08492.1 putative membrane protein [Frondihabitans sp. PhB161]